jgi:hypothetical protein
MKIWSKDGYRGFFNFECYRKLDSSRSTQKPQTFQQTLTVNGLLLVLIANSLQMF